MMTTIAVKMQTMTNMKRRVVMLRLSQLIARKVMGGEIWVRARVL
jgi:hypothetical protein